MWVCVEYRSPAIREDLAVFKFLSQMHFPWCVHSTCCSSPGRVISHSLWIMNFQFIRELTQMNFQSLCIFQSHRILIGILTMSFKWYYQLQIATLFISSVLNYGSLGSNGTGKGKLPEVCWTLGFNFKTCILFTYWIWNPTLRPNFKVWPLGLLKLLVLNDNLNISCCVCDSSFLAKTQL